MNKVTFADLPRPVKEHLLWEMELDYCSYESSKEACIHGILNDSYDLDRNKNNIANYMLALSKESLERHVCHVLDRLQTEQEATKTFLVKSVYGLK